MNIFYGKNHILVKQEDGSSACSSYEDPKLLEKEKLAIYFQIKEDEIKEEHIKRWLNNEA